MFSRMTSTEPKGFSLSVLRESLLKAQSDSSVARRRIRRLRSEVVEVDKRIKDQSRQNTSLRNEVTEMKNRAESLQADIKGKNAQLDQLTAANCEFVKVKVVEPAEQGIAFANETIECFNEIIASSYKLNLLFKRENPEKTDAQTQLDLPFPLYSDLSEEDQNQADEVLRLQNEIFKKQEVIREAKNIARGNKSSSRMFASIGKLEWDEKVAAIHKLEEEEKQLELEIQNLENEINKTNGDDSLTEQMVVDPPDASGEGFAASDATGDDTNEDNFQQQNFSEYQSYD